MQPGYPQQTPYGRGAYGGDYGGMSRNGYMAQNAMVYNQYPAAAYGQNYGYQQYPGAAMYGGGMPQGYGPNPYQMGPGRGAFYPPVGRGGYRGAYRGARGGFRGRRKKPFVGGTLETQKEWERETACCFFMQGKCKFGENCRFLHEENSTLQCQFGDKCRVHGSAKDDDKEAEGEDTEKKTPTSTEPAKEAAKETAKDAAEKPAAEKPTEEDAEVSNTA